MVLEVLNLRSAEISALKIISAENQRQVFQPDLMEQQVLEELQHVNIIFFK